jgi:hypothetical protein
VVEPIAAADDVDEGVLPDETAADAGVAAEKAACNKDVHGWWLRAPSSASASPGKQMRLASGQGPNRRGAPGTPCCGTAVSAGFCCLDAEHEARRVVASASAPMAARPGSKHADKEENAPRALAAALAAWTAELVVGTGGGHQNREMRLAREDSGGTSVRKGSGGMSSMVTSALVRSCLESEARNMPSSSAVEGCPRGTM